MSNQKSICVTGATGFIASHIVMLLLEKGYRVKGTVRNLSRLEKVPWLAELAAVNEKLDLFESDLLAKDSFNTAVEGCHTVIHTASPYVINVQDPEKELLQPAVIGTENILAACQRSGSVQRVVLTSSFAAVTDEPDSNIILSENDWNSSSSLKRNPYHYSKTMAERSAWDFIRKHHPSFDLVVINPFMVVGPSLTPSANTTNLMIRDIMTGVYPGILDLNWGFVDVRDVAAAHVLAMEKPEAEGRYLCAGDSLHMRELVNILRTGGYERSFTLPRLDLTGKAGSMLVRLLSYTQPRDTGMYIRTHLGKTIRYDNAKIIRDLGVRFRPAKESILETVEDMIAWGHLKKR